MTCNGYYCSQSQPKNNNQTWMKNIPGNRKISEMTIPGTHDTCARNLFYYAETQKWSVEDQLKAGIRLFDMRCRHYQNNFLIHHGSFYCSITFGDCLNIIQKFLKENPSEAVIMRVKEEYNAFETSRSFRSSFELNYMNCWPGLIHLSETIPTLDDIRGKIWAIVDFDYDKMFRWNQIIMQDEYIVNYNFYFNKDTIDNKINNVKAQLQIAISGDKNTLYGNFFSGAGTMPPTDVAGYTNRLIYNYKGRLGFVLFDFPGEDIIKHCIDQN